MWKKVIILNTLKIVFVSLVLFHMILTAHNLLIILLYCSNKKIILIFWTLVNLCPSMIVLVKKTSFLFRYFKGFSWYFPTSKFFLVPNICKVSYHPICKVRIYYFLKTSFYFVYNYVFLMSMIYFFR